MKIRPLRWLLVVLLLSLSAGMTAGGHALSVLPEPEQSSQSTLALNSGSDSYDTYYLWNNHGELCVSQNSTIVLRTGVAVSSLPADDRAALAEGISVRSREALASLLEDLTS